MENILQETGALFKEEKKSLLVLCNLVLVNVDVYLMMCFTVTETQG